MQRRKSKSLLGKGSRKDWIKRWKNEKGRRKKKRSHHKWETPSSRHKDIIPTTSEGLDLRERKNSSSKKFVQRSLPPPLPLLHTPLLAGGTHWFDDARILFYKFQVRKFGKKEFLAVTFRVNSSSSSSSDLNNKSLYSRGWGFRVQF